MTPERENPFASLPLVRHTRELGAITGRSRSVGWIFDDPAFFLYGLIKWFKPDLVIQTGHLWGKSALVALEALHDGFLGPGMRIEGGREEADRAVEEFVEKNSPARSPAAKVISIDPFSKNIPNQGAGIGYLENLYGPGKFEFCRMRSIDFFEKHGSDLKRAYAGKRILGIVDGDHSWQGAVWDMEHLRDLGCQMIVVDDTIWLPHLGRAVREFASRHRDYELLNLTFYTGTALFWKRDFRTGPKKREALGVSWHEVVYVVGGMALWRIARAVRKAAGRTLGRQQRLETGQ